MSVISVNDRRAQNWLSRPRASKSASRFALSESMEWTLFIVAFFVVTAGATYALLPYLPALGL